MDESEVQQDPIEKKQEQPVNPIFRVFLIFSMINAATSVFSYLTIGASLPFLSKSLSDNTLPIPEGSLQMVKEILNWPRYYFFIMIPFFALSFLGALRMWKLRVSGFHCYTSAQLILILLPLIFIGKSAVNLGDIMFTALFIFYYGVIIFNKKREIKN